jgi:hypothetical protein
MNFNANIFFSGYVQMVSLKYLNVDGEIFYCLTRASTPNCYMTRTGNFQMIVNN